MSGAINIKMANKILQGERECKTANKGAGLRDGWKVFFYCFADPFTCVVVDG
jgi:hypothetical protein